MLSKQIQYLVLSDIHLGNKRNPTTNIIKNLDIFFDDYTTKSKFLSLDIIFIAGDLFDTLLDFSSNDIHEITLWLGRLLNFCNRFNIKLRILEGTPSHDNGQSKIVTTLDILTCVFNMSPTIKTDVKYINTLFIETIVDLGLTVLYLPDEWSYSSEDTLNQVRELLLSNNLQTVDISIQHGLYNYQLKDVPCGNIKHSEEDYLLLVKYFINIGHIHVFSTYDRIIAQGSFDRIAHGEESPKGAVLCTINSFGDSYFTFIENKHAKVFKTVELRYKDITKNLLKINKEIVDLPDDSYIRISAKRDNPIFDGFDKLRLDYPTFTFTKHRLDDVEETLTKAVINDPDYTPITITEENIARLLLNEINTKYTLTSKQLNLLTELL